MRPVLQKSISTGALLAVSLSFAPVLGAAGEIDFNRDIKPILSENCYFCHGFDEKERKAGLRLDTFEGATTEDEGGAAIVPGDPQASRLVQRIFSEDPDDLMPPPEAKIKLTPQERDLLKRWIAGGAEYQDHWAFTPPARSDIAAGEHPIDQLVAQILKGSVLSASPQADKRTLIRRITLDLTGLPPTPEEVERFLEDRSPHAYEKVVDRLLASPAYGERMAWDWLDAARYADSNGYQGDNERTMWPWRDWVVRAFNENLPYDQFTVWQIAGDLLPNATFEQKLATGFLRNHPINGEGGRIPEENRVDYVFDMTETFGTVWLGLTLNCCRCHDHKFDPLSQRDYYQLSAYFNQTPGDGSSKSGQTAPVLTIPTAEGKELETKQVKADSSGIKVMVMQDMPKTRDTFILDKGLYTARGEKANKGTPASLPPLPEGARTDRLALARWLVSPENPLAARVAVNRFWQQLFGIGLVKTAEDFGTQGETPVQQALLDHLAVSFRESAWDVKALLKLIATSATYKQSSKATPLGDDGTDYQLDPENRMLSRGPRFRMPSWMLRDSALAASGLLVRELGGAPVNTYQPEGIWEEASFGKKRYKRDSGDKLYRRGLYTFWRRIIAPPAFFDNAGRQTCSVKPFRTNTPLHALYTFNDTTFVEAARILARDVLHSESDGERGAIDLVFDHVLSRPADDDEAAALLRQLQRSREHFSKEPKEAELLLSAGEQPRDKTLDPAEHAAWTALCLATLNLDEALTKE